MLKTIRNRIYISLSLLCMFLLTGCAASPGDIEGTGSVGLFEPQSAVHTIEHDGYAYKLGFLEPVKKIAVPLAVISVALCAFILIVSPDQRSVETAKNGLKNIIIGLIFLAASKLFAGWILNV